MAGLGQVASPGRAQEAYPVPQFRHVEPSVKAPDVSALGEIKLLADADFPPFSYGAGDGRAAGIAIDLALTVCSELRLRCSVILRPWSSLMPALARGEGDGVISGPRLDEKALENAVSTRPFYRAIGRFAVKRDSPLQSVDAASLTDKRIGVVKGSSHAAWIARHFSDSEVTEFDNHEAAREALKASQVDALFGDALSLIYWVEGRASDACCKLIGGGFVDPATISPPMVFLLRRDRGVLREAFDYGLDRMQTSGAFAAIFRRYVPLSPW